jgi:hypothetical protein
VGISKEWLWTPGVIECPVCKCTAHIWDVQFPTRVTSHHEPSGKELRVWLKCEGWPTGICHRFTLDFEDHSGNLSVRMVRVKPDISVEESLGLQDDQAASG